MKPTTYLYLLISIFFLGCESEKTYPPIDLPPAPEDVSRYLIMNIDDKVYEYDYKVHPSDTSFALSIQPSAEIPSFGTAIIANDTTKFMLVFRYQASSYNELIAHLITENHEFSREEIDTNSGETIAISPGFLLKIPELNDQGEVGTIYSSAFIDQPESSFVNISNYYASNSDHLIWLQGTFDLKVNGHYAGSQIEGEFFILLPVDTFQ